MDGCGWGCWFWLFLVFVLFVLMIGICGVGDVLFDMLVVVFGLYGFVCGLWYVLWIELLFFLLLYVEFC